MSPSEQVLCPLLTNRVLGGHRQVVDDRFRGCTQVDTGELGGG